MDLQRSLQQLGLTENQTKVYLACLQLGKDTVLNIAKYANVKRPSTYIILEELQKQGLVTKISEGKKSYFKAEKPERFQTNLRVQQEIIGDILPTLKAIHNFDPNKPNIRIADGVHAVRKVYDDIFAYLEAQPKEELIIFGSLKDAMGHFEHEVVNYFHQLMSKASNRVREIGNDDKETRQYFRESHKLNPRHHIRLIKDEEQGMFWETDDFLYGNTLVIFSVKKDIFAIIIESESIAKTYKTLFNMAWRSGKKLYKWPPWLSMLS